MLIQYFLRTLALEGIYYEQYDDVYAFYDTHGLEIGESEFLCTIHVGERCRILEVSEHAYQFLLTYDDYFDDFEPRYLKQKVLLITHFPGSSRTLSVKI